MNIKREHSSLFPLTLIDYMASLGSKKRPYRHRVICEKCQKEINSDNKENHIKTKHNGRDVKFTIAQDKKQCPLCFGLSSSTSKCEFQFMGSVNLSVPIDTDPLLPIVTTIENTQIKLKGQNIVKISEENAGLIENKSKVYDDPSQSTANQYSPHKSDKYMCNLPAM